MDNLRKYRQKMGWRQNDLAAKTGCAREHIANIERGTRQPSLPIAMSLVDVLKLSSHDAVKLLRDLAGLPPAQNPDPGQEILEALCLSPQAQAQLAAELRTLPPEARRAHIRRALSAAPARMAA